MTRWILCGVAVLATAATALSHPDDPKALTTAPAFRGGGWTEKVGGVKPLSFGSSNLTLRSWVTPPELFDSGGSLWANDCWGYTAPSGREYGIIGTQDGTAFVEVTDPGDPQVIEHIGGPNSIWRDMKIYQDRCYIVSEGGDGIQVVDLSQIDNGVVTLVTEITGQGTNATHNVAIDEDSGYLYRCGGGPNGLRIYSLANPDNPVFVGEWQDRYVHDAVIVTYDSGPFAGQQIAFCCGGLNGGFSDTGLDIVDVTDKANPVVLFHLSYPNPSYSHQAWLSEDRQYLYLNDELNEQDFGLNSTTVIINVADINAPFVAGEFTNSSFAATHNLYIKGDKLYAANYLSGLRIYDISNRENPVEVGFFDTAPNTDSNETQGLWSSYPFFPSGTIIGSDRQRGLFVWTEDSVTVDISFPEGRPTLLGPGGGSIPVQIDVDGLAAGAATATLRYDDGNGAQSVALTDLGNGDFSADFPALTCPGLVQWSITYDTGGGNTYRSPLTGTYQLTVGNGAVAFADDFETGLLNWTVINDPGLTDGAWERGTPDGGGSRGDPAIDADGSGRCYLTDNEFGNSDVDGGATDLRSPIIDATGEGDAYLVYDRWYSNDVGAVVDDSMQVLISNNAGSTWTLVEDVTENADAWVNKRWLISDSVLPTETMQVRFVASDLGQGSVVEAGVDGVQILLLNCETVNPACDGDVDGNGAVDADDILAVINAWFTSGSNGTDLDGNNFVDTEDLLIVVNNWGPCPTP